MGHLLPIAFFFRNFRSGAGRALLVSHHHSLLLGTRQRVVAYFSPTQVAGKVGVTVAFGPNWLG